MSVKDDAKKKYRMKKAVSKTAKSKKCNPYSDVLKGDK